jgi:hypothetical protein
MINEEKTIPMPHLCHRIEQRIYIVVLQRNREREERGVSFFVPRRERTAAVERSTMTNIQ